MRDRILAAVALALLVVGTGTAPMTYTFDEPGWTLVAPPGTAEIGSAHGYSSPFNALSVSGVDPGDPFSSRGGYAYRTLAELESGKTYIATVWAYPDEADEDSPLTVFVAPSGPPFLFAGLSISARIAMETVSSGGQVVDVFTLNIPNGVDPSTLWLGIGILNDLVPPNAAVAKARGRWTADDLRFIDVETPQGVIYLRKRAALNAFRDALLSMSPAGGYATTLTGGVLKATIFPDDDHAQIQLPYACIQLTPWSQPDIESQYFVCDWGVNVLFFGPESWRDPKNADTVDYFLDLWDDLHLMRLQNPDLAGTVNEFSFDRVSPEEAGVLPGEPFVPMAAQFTFKQFFDAQNLTVV